MLLIKEIKTSAIGKYFISWFSTVIVTGRNVSGSFVSDGKYLPVNRLLQFVQNCWRTIVPFLESWHSRNVNSLPYHSSYEQMESEFVEERGSPSFLLLFVCLFF